MTKLFDVECTRHNVTPKEFYRYCQKRMESKGLSMDCFCDSYEVWANPIRYTERHTNRHEDWDEPRIEGICIMPFELQLYLEKGYNFILEFEFWDENTGSGYMYAMEYER